VGSGLFLLELSRQPEPQNAQVLGESGAAALPGVPFPLTRSFRLRQGYGGQAGPPSPSGLKIPHRNQCWTLAASSHAQTSAKGHARQDNSRKFSSHPLALDPRGRARVRARARARARATLGMGECVSLRRQHGNLVRSAGKDIHAWMISPRPGTRSDPRPSLRCPAPSILGKPKPSGRGKGRLGEADR
jgi:hypothetical protein